MNCDLHRSSGIAGGLGRTSRVGLVAAALALLSGLAPAQQGLVVSPSLSITETRTNNRDAASVDRQADLITQISPGIDVLVNRGQVRGVLSYALNGLIYAEKPVLNSVYHSLSSQGVYTSLDGRFGVEAAASAGRQVISAFGTQYSDPVLNTTNQSQVYSYRLAPHFSGRLLGEVSYHARLAYAGSHSSATSAGDAASLIGSAGLSGRRGNMGWAVDASRAVYENGDQPRGHNGSVVASLNYSIDFELQLSARLGSEVDDMVTGQSQRSTMWGAGLAWSPGPRTVLRADYDRRFYGKSHALALNHRMANTIWSISDTRSLQTGGTAGRSVISLYDQLFALMASVEPDPVKRDAYVRSLIAASGFNVNDRVVVGGFLTGAAAVQRVQLASMAYQGQRQTLSIAYVQTRSRSVAADPVTGDDLANNAHPQQKGLTLTVSHRLTPDSALVVALGQQRTAATAAQPANDLRTIAATWSAKLGIHTDVSLGVRYSSFDNDANPYQESAIFGSLRLRF